MRKLPKLRFKEFSDEWEEKKLEEIANIYDGTHQTPRYVEKGIPFYSVENITNNDFINTKFVSEEDYIENNKKRKIEKNDILMTRIGSIGGSKLIDWEIVADFYVSLALIKLKDKIYPSYINQFIKSSFFQKELDKRTLKVAFPQKINLIEIGECLIRLPIQEEQEKIANFLSSIDKKISLTEEKLELFREYKRGVMQKIFSQELRFKDSEGNDYPEWEERKLGEISEVKDGTHDSPKYVSNGFPLVTSKNVKNGKIDLNEVNYISKEDFDIINKRSKVSKGDILMGMIGTIGNLAIVDREDFAIKNVALIKEKSDLKNNFLIYLLQSYVFHKKIALLNEGGTQKFISLGNIRNLLFFIPTLEEQQKIADFLSSIDSKIESIEKELEGLKEFKRGLLQQMFV